MCDQKMRFNLIQSDGFFKAAHNAVMGLIKTEIT